MKELLGAIGKTGVEYGSVRIGFSDDLGRGARRSPKMRGDDISVRGVFSAARGGYGFVTPDGGGGDIFISASKTAGAVDGDLVEVVYTEYETDGEIRTDGRVIEISERGRRSLFGTVDESVLRIGRRTRSTLVLVPDESRLPYRPEITDSGGARIGDKVECEIVRSGEYFTCRVREVFGRADTKEANYRAILCEEGIPVDFSQEELSEAQRAASEPISFDGREDRTNEIVFTIDGEGAKDLDDAVTVRRLSGGGYLLGVYIADVAHYVKERTALDRAVMARGTSVYFTDKVVPMLPSSLSNGACSLNAGEEKYALGANISLDGEGNIKRLRLSECVIKSRLRGVYSEVNELLSGGGERELKKKYAPVMGKLEILSELYERLKEKRKKRGSVDFDAPEAEIILDSDGTVKDIIRRERGRAERIIEELMLTANEAVATRLFEAKIPCVYRIHEPPPPDKLSDFVDYLHALGFNARVINKEGVTTADLSRVLDIAEKRGLSEPVSYNMLRAMSKAKYSDKRQGHFGLGIENYCHFTSPIRRLSDLATHRIIKRVIMEEKSPRLYSGYARRAAAAATEGELRAVYAERRIENLYKTIYMSSFIGQTFPAVVGSVTKFGLFAVLENTVEGLIPISELDGYFVFDEKTLTIRSRERSYRTADRITVRLVEADIGAGKLRFEIAD